MVRDGQAELPCGVEVDHELELAWLLHRPGVTAPIVGATKPEHLRDALAAEQLRLEPEESIRLEEPYVAHKDPRVLPRATSTRDNFGPYVVPQDHLFMMGDNRDNSHDSRFWGALPRRLVKGKAMFLYWSWDADRRLPRLERLLRPIR